MKFVFFVLFQFYFLTVFAGCGLDHCRCDNSSSKESHHFDFSLSSQYTSFSYHSKNGSYFEHQLGLSYSYKSSWSVELMLPYISFEYEHHSVSGFGDPSINVRKWFSFESFRPFLGIQVTAPLGEDRKGIAMDHYGILPHLGFAIENESYFFQVASGYRFMINKKSNHAHSGMANHKKWSEDMAGMDHSTMGHSTMEHMNQPEPNGESLAVEDIAMNFVNYHEEGEMQFFSNFQKHFLKKKLSLGVHSMVKKSIKGDDTYLFLYGGPELVVRVKDFLFMLSSNVPFSHDKKMDFDVHLSVSYSF